jgi:polyisoprenoid-binding protein YceI
VTTIFTAVFLLAASANVVSAADKYELDTSHTSVEFAVKHMVISTVKGAFSDVTGTILYDEKDITKSSVDVLIKVASVNTNNEKRDEHLKSADFLDAGKYPDITFKSKQVQKTDEGLVLTGILTIRDVSKEVSMPFEITGKLTDPWGNVRIGAETELEINRQDYGVSWSKNLDGGGLVVGDKVKIEISLEGVKK